MTVPFLAFSKRFVLLPLSAALLAGCGTLTQAPSELSAQALTAPVRHPVLFVHGFNSDGSIWSPMMNRFKQDGWTDAQLFSWSYDSFKSNAVTADLLRQKVDAILAQTGATQVDIVSHSMGALSSRYYLKNLGGTAKVDAWVSLGGPNHSTDFALACSTASCIEMRQGSSFIKALNSGDETPGAVRYATWWSPCDAVINPNSSVPLSGATNTKTSCLTHSSLYGDATVYAQVRDFIGR